MKTLNQLILDYTKHLQQGDLQVAYRGILDYIGKLRNDFVSKYPDYEIGNNVYQGYMDMSYFSLNIKQLKVKGLKIAIVYLHQKGAFEIWLSARNREILKKHKTILNGKALEGSSFFHDVDNEDAIIECTLTSEPDFDKQTLLTEIIEDGTEKFLSAITILL